MPRAYSQDLRDRVIDAVMNGGEARERPAMAHSSLVFRNEGQPATVNLPLHVGSHMLAGLGVQRFADD